MDVSDDPLSTPFTYVHFIDVLKLGRSLGPGSFLEVQKILPLLVEGSSEYPAFHVVAFSLPGYAFSEGPKKQGFSPKQCAEASRRIKCDLPDIHVHELEHAGRQYTDDSSWIPPVW